MSTTGRLSRRGVVGAVGAAAIACGLPGGAKAQAYHPQAQKQLTKAAAKYQDHPNGDQLCAGCPYFMSPNHCVVVAGEISPSGWCPMFTTFSPLDRGAHT